MKWIASKHPETKKLIYSKKAEEAVEGDELDTPVTSQSLALKRAKAAKSPSRLAQRLNKRSR
jgi:hypothetical protein